MSGQTKEYWTAIAEARDLDALKSAIDHDRDAAREALAELTNMLQHLDCIQASSAVDQLRWLGTAIAGVTDEPQAAAGMRAQRLQRSAMNLLQQGNRAEAVSHFVQAASLATQAGRTQAAFHVSLMSVSLLFSLGELEMGLTAAEGLLEATEGWSFATRHTRSMLYQLVQCTKKAPAGDGWAMILARIEAGMRQAGDQSLAAVVSSALAQTLTRSGFYEDAVEMFADANSMLERMRMVGPGGEWLEVPESSEARFWSARALDLRGNDDAAEEAYRSHPAFADHAAPEHDGLISRLVELLVENDRLQEALDMLESSEPDHEYQPLWRALQAKIYGLLNLPEASAAAAVQAREPLEVPESAEEKDSTFHRLAATEGQAIEQLFQSNEVESRLHLVLAESAITRGNVSSQNLEEVTRALSRARRVGDRALEARCCHSLGEIEFAAGNPQAAAKLLQDALECELTPATRGEWRQYLDRSGPTFPEQVRRDRWRRTRAASGVGIQIQLSLGRAQMATGVDPSVALDIAIGGARRRNRQLVLYSALSAKGGWLSSAGRGEEAWAVWSDAANVLESLRAGLSGVSLQIGLLQDKERPFDELLAAAAAAGDSEAAIRIMERAKSRAFLEQIRTGVAPPPLSGDAEAEARDLRLRLVRTLSASTPLDAAAELELQRMKNRFASLFRAGDRRTQPVAAALGADIAQLSAAGISVVEYFVSPQRSFAVTAHQGKLTPPVALELGGNDLAEILETLDFELGVRERCRSLELLYDALFAPLEPQLRGASRLLIVPHGLLHRAPLHALRGRDKLYLAQRFPIHYASSVGLAKEVARRPQNGVSGGALLLAATQTPYCALPTLNFAAIETAEAAKSLPGCVVLTGAEAVRRHLVRRQENLEILHCACHGEYDRDDPLMSRLYLADGPLYGYEIERLRFRPRVVVLSACESGIQKRMGGDETFGLIRALVSRGAETVISSLWKVADESTANLMGAFYSELAQIPGDAAAALRNAQLRLLGEPRYAHPFYWAPYFATGAMPSGAL